MSLYHLWNPHAIAPRTVRAYLTESEALHTGHGTDALIAAVASAIGVGAIDAWTWRPIRTQYFTSYRDDPHAWQDAWGLAFELTLELREPAIVARPPPSGRYPIDEGDASYRHAAPPDHARLPCVVLADLPDEDAADAAIALAPAGAVVSRGVAMRRFPSIAIDLGPCDEAFFAAGATEAEALVATLAAAGASVNVENTLTWILARAS